MAIEHSVLNPALGACVRGVDLAGITRSEFDRLYEIWQRHHVLVLRGQELTNAQFERFCAMLGELDPPPNDDGEAHWHSDMACLERPPWASVLWAIELPAVGGNTWFTGMPAALRSMPANLVRRIETLSIRHADSGGHLGKDMVDDNEPAGSAGTLHPMVIGHPETGERTLYLGRRRNACIAGLPRQESERLLDIVWGYATAPEIALCHRWQLGDVVLSNNLTTMQRCDALPPGQARTLRRSQVKGRYVPAAALEKKAA